MASALIGGLILWGYGVWWLSLAILKTVRYLRQGLPFNLGWWGFTFPLAVYTLATLALARIHRAQPFQFHRRRTRGVPGDLLARRGEPHFARGVEHDAVRCPLSQRRQRAGAV